MVRTVARGLLGRGSPRSSMGASSARWRFGEIIEFGRVAAIGLVHGPVGAWYHSEVIVVQALSFRVVAQLARSPRLASAHAQSQCQRHSGDGAFWFADRPIGAGHRAEVAATDEPVSRAVAQVAGGHRLGVRAWSECHRCSHSACQRVTGAVCWSMAPSGQHAWPRSLLKSMVAGVAPVGSWEPTARCRRVAESLLVCRQSRAERSSPGPPGSQSSWLISTSWPEASLFSRLDAGESQIPGIEAFRIELEPHRPGRFLGDRAFQALWLEAVRRRVLSRRQSKVWRRSGSRRGVVGSRSLLLLLVLFLCRLDSSVNLPAAAKQA